MEVRRSPRKKSPSPISSSVYTTSSGSSDSIASEEDTQEKRKPKDRDYKPSHPEPGSSCSSASSTPKKKRRRKESPKAQKESIISESEDGSRSDPLELQSNLSGVPRKRNQLRSSRQARWRKGLTEVAVRDYDHSMVKGFLKQVSAHQRKNFSVESWDSDDIGSDDDDDDDCSPLREEEEEKVPVAKVVPNETFIKRLQTET